MLSSSEIRTRFLSFFERRGHTIVPSSSLVPADDPTLLFTNAGMVQFKDTFLGREERSYSRATTAQKCMRVSGKHNDLEEVGPSPRHHTFFEMLGNFSFGDYFKAEAIRYGWDFLTKEIGLDPDRLYVTVYQDDDQAYDLWRDEIGIPAERIGRLSDNFWEMGDTGPCGPCSEIHYDRGSEACSCGQPDCRPGDECDRWLELWNLVFMQFERHADGSTTPLPNPSIDTGLGLDRLTSVIQSVDNNYETDLFLPIMERTQQLLGQSDVEREKNMVAYRIIADHSRAITFLIADGVLPGNAGRNYVLRLILRRAARYGRKLGFREPFLAKTASAVIEKMGQHYNELEQRRDFICQAITQEEERFLATLDTGLARLDELVAELKREGEHVIPGREAFRLYDTYGFPLELTVDAVEEAGMEVDREGFQRAMAEQRERARSAQQFAFDAQAEFYGKVDLPDTEFLGYEHTETEAEILAIAKDQTLFGHASEGEEVDLVLSRTPFYAESGGQVGDQGTLIGPEGQASIYDTVQPLPGLFVHKAKVLRGTLRTGQLVDARVDRARRLDVARNHTATHLLHRALRLVLGEHAAQSGSLVAPERLRFDFSHLAPLTQEELRRIEFLVNEQIRANLPVETEVTSYEQALEKGAVALFGEKYGDRVRMVRVKGFSSELCGGTHLQATGQIGQFIIVDESSVGSGLRRIEAITGRAATRYMRQHLDTLSAIGEAISAPSGEELEHIQDLLEQLDHIRREMESLQQRLAAQQVDDLLGQATEVGETKLLTVQVEAPDVETLRNMCDRFRDQLGSSVVALGALVDGRPRLVVGLTEKVAQAGLNAGQLASQAAQRMGGGGGGSPTMAQAGGSQADKLSETLDAVHKMVIDALD